MNDSKLAVVQRHGRHAEPVQSLVPAGDPILDSPLCGELIGDMEVLEDISQSLSDDTFNSLHVLDYQSNNTAADSSTGLGRAYRHTILTNQAP